MFWKQTITKKKKKQNIKFNNCDFYFPDFVSVIPFVVLVCAAESKGSTKNVSVIIME